MNLFHFSLFFFFFLVGTIIAQNQCPNNCSGHGQCVNTNCRCDVGWVGDDCSIAETAISNSRSLNGHVERFQWHVYYTNEASSKFYVELNQTGPGDCDLYIQYNDVPTRSSFLYRDITTDRHVKIDVTPSSEQQSGKWYFGVYGFLACDYIITFSTSDCPNDCSGHGTCHSASCTCEDGWTATDCSVRKLNLNEKVEGNLERSGQDFYRLHFEAGNQLLFQLHETNQDGDCDLYVRYQEKATITEWDYSNITIQKDSEIRIQDAYHGYWFATVHAFRSCAYTLKAIGETNNCPNQCSKHGQCSGGQCNCESGFTGEACETMTQNLQNNVEVDGFVESNEWNYFSFQSDSIKNMMITLNQKTDDGDCDLYVKRQERPTRFSYDKADISIRKSFTMVIEDVGEDKWYIGVFGWKKCSFTVKISETSTCPNDCSGHGQCRDSVCQCDSGYSGEDCSDHLVVLSNNEVKRVTHQASDNFANKFDYFQFTTNPTSSVHIQVREINTKGLLWVYVGKETPTLESYDYSDTETGSSIHRINIEFKEPEEIEYFIGVYGNPYILDDQVIEYEIIVYAPPF